MTLFAYLSVNGGFQVVIMECRTNLKRNGPATGVKAQKRLENFGKLGEKTAKTKHPGTGGRGVKNRRDVSFAAKNSYEIWVDNFPRLFFWGLSGVPTYLNGVFISQINAADLKIFIFLPRVRNFTCSFERFVPNKTPANFYLFWFDAVRILPPGNLLRATVPWFLDGEIMYSNHPTNPVKEIKRGWSVILNTKNMAGFVFNFMYPL